MRASVRRCAGFGVLALLMWGAFILLSWAVCAQDAGTVPQSQPSVNTGAGQPAAPADFDLSTLAGVALATSFIVSALKKYVPKIIGYERLAAVVVSVGLVVASKLTGIGFADMPWVNLIIAGIVGGPVSGTVFEHLTKQFKKST